VYYPDSVVYRSAIEALGNIGSEAAIPALLKATERYSPDGCSSAIEALGNIGSEAAIPVLLKAINVADSVVCQSAIKALGKIGSEPATLALLKAIDCPNWKVRQSAAEALGSIGNPQPLKLLWQKQLKSPDYSIAQAITAIQNRCKFYNYELFQSEAIQEEPHSSQSTPTVIYDQRGATIGNLAHEVHGNQTTQQTPPPSSP
jgi:HEAT repeat protein